MNCECGCKRKRGVFIDLDIRGENGLIGVRVYFGFLLSEAYEVAGCLCCIALCFETFSIIIC